MRGRLSAPPRGNFVDAICSIDRAALPRGDAFHLWGRRLNEKSRGRFYDDIEEDLQVLERDYADELAAIDGIANVHLLIRAQAAEYTNKRELAYARSATWRDDRLSRRSCVRTLTGAYSACRSPTTSTPFVTRNSLATPSSRRAMASKPCIATLPAPTSATFMTGRRHSAC